MDLRVRQYVLINYMQPTLRPLPIKYMKVRGGPHSRWTRCC